MKEQTKEKIAFLVVLLFCLAYLIPWSYNKVIIEPREVTEKEQFELSEKYRTVDPYATKLMTWKSVPATGVAISAEELESLNSDSNELTLGSEASVGEILVLPEEGADYEGQILTIDDSGGVIALEKPVDKLKVSHRIDSTITSCKQEQNIAYFIMPKSIDLLIKDFISWEREKGETYQLIWEWMGFDYMKDDNAVIVPKLHPLYQDDITAIRSVKDFIEWLYENDYEIVKKEK